MIQSTHYPIENIVPNPQAIIIFNPAAGQAESLQKDLQASRDLLVGYGWSVELRPTQGPGDGTRIAHEAAQAGLDIVIAAGGDGTINEVINGLAGSQTALGVLPVGTVNVWAREIGFPLQPRATTEALLQAHIRQIDLGRVDQRYFLLMASVGFDAAVVNEVRPEEKRRLGVMAYAWRAISLGIRFRGMRVRVSMDGRVLRRRILMIVIGNTQLYAGFLKITARASIDDGLLDVCLIKGDNLLAVPLHLATILLQRYSFDPKFEYHRVRSIRIESRRSLPVQADGELIGQTPVTIQVVPGALRVLLPPSLPQTDLLSDTSVTRSRSLWRYALGRVFGRE